MHKDGAFGLDKVIRVDLCDLIFWGWFHIKGGEIKWRHLHTPIFYHMMSDVTLELCQTRKPSIQCSTLSWHLQNYESNNSFFSIKQACFRCSIKMRNEINLHKILSITSLFFEMNQRLQVLKIERCLQWEFMKSCFM